MKTVTTNQPMQLDVKFAGLMSEGLAYANLWTPTEINEGGCGVFAIEIAKRLKQLNIPYKIFAIYYNDKDKDYESNLKKLIETGKIPDSGHTGANHIIIEVAEELFIDAMGVINAQAQIATDKVELSDNILEVLVNNIGSWNPTFDRDCIPVIEEKLDEVFSHLNDYHPGIFTFPKDGQVKFTAKTMRYKHRSFSLSDIFNS